MDEKERARRWLSRYIELHEDYLRELDRATELKNEARSLSSSKLSLAPKSKSVKSIIEESVIKFMTASEMCADLAIQAETAKQEIVDVIGSIGNTEHRRALRYKYLDNMPNKHIAHVMHYSYSYMNNLLSKAVEDVTQCDKYLSYTIL